MKKTIIFGLLFTLVPICARTEVIGHHKFPDEWFGCKSDIQCTVIVGVCIGGDVAVNEAYRNKLTAVANQKPCSTLLDMTHNPGATAECFKGKCVIVDNSVRR